MIYLFWILRRINSDIDKTTDVVLYAVATIITSQAVAMFMSMLNQLLQMSADAAGAEHQMIHC